MPRIQYCCRNSTEREVLGALRSPVLTPPEHFDKAIRQHRSQFFRDRLTFHKPWQLHANGERLQNFWTGATYGTDRLLERLAVGFHDGLHFSALLFCQAVEQ